MLEGSIFDLTDGVTTTKNYSMFLLALGAAVLLGLMISFVYMRIHKQKFSPSFVLTLVILPPIVTAIIFLVGTNIASAFSLAGAFAIIRFRSEPGDTKDIAYVLFIMAVGLACGLGYILYAAIIAVVLCVLVIVLELVKFGKHKDTVKNLKITLPENMEFQDVFNDIFEKYTNSYSINRIKTTELGSLYVVEFSVSLKNGINEKSFIDELRCRNGNLSISLMQVVEVD